MLLETMEDMYLSQARNATNMNECMSIYDKWASTYNAEVKAMPQQYVAPQIVATAALQSPRYRPKCWILDAGCGTGLVGEALAQNGAQTIDGIDLSTSMLGMAKETGVYRNLAQVDLTRRIGIADEVYDIVTCAGTFTSGHVGPHPTLEEFVRIVKKGGLVVATVLEKFWHAAKFRETVERLQSEGRVLLIADGTIDYVKGHNDRAILLILERRD